MEKKVLQKAVEQVLADGKGKRKFVQSVDLALNFREVDFKKPENRLNADVILPHPPRKEKVAVFADGQLNLDARNAGADIAITAADIPSYASDKVKQKALVQCSILSSPQLIAQVGKALGQALSSKGKTPKPIMPNADLKQLIERTRSTISIRCRGKYLPTVHCIVGKEGMEASDIADNILMVLETVEKKIPEQKIASLFVKTTMGKPVKITL